MLFHVWMDVAVPHDLEPERRTALLTQERERALELQRSGVWPHLWRVVGEYSAISVFDVDSGDQLHSLLSSLPLFPYMKIKVTPLGTHPSDLRAQP